MTDLLEAPPAPPAPRYTLVLDGRERSATAEQADIIAFACERRESLLVNALAGSAKTSTLQFICKYHPIVPILSLAFNKRIAEEMQRRLPGHVKSATMNSVGHRTWAAAIGKRLMVDTKKSYNALKEAVDALSRSEKSDAYDSFGDILKTVSAAKLQGYVPKGAPDHGKRLTTADGFFGGLEEEPEGWFCDLVNSVLRKSITSAYAGLIDFDDQIYMPTLFGGSFPQYPLVMADEAQDLSPLNHAMLERLVGTRRLIAVGDPWQSIYAFRGAMTGGMKRLRERFNMEERTLSISFRCPRAVVERARSRVPHMRWPEWAVEGRVETLSEWTHDTIPDGAAIICRNNAPLFSCALRLIRAGRGVQLVGTDLGPQLVRTLKKLGEPTLTQEQVYDAIDKWEHERARKARNEGTVRDKAECLRVFAGFGPTLGAAIAYAEHLFSSKGPIQLLSGHKAKGLEWDTVYHLDPHRVPSPWARSEEDLEQERNIEYVITTRAKRELLFVTVEGFDG